MERPDLLWSIHFWEQWSLWMVLIFLLQPWHIAMKVYHLEVWWLLLVKEVTFRRCRQSEIPSKKAAAWGCTWHCWLNEVPEIDSTVLEGVGKFYPPLAQKSWSQHPKSKRISGKKWCNWKWQLHQNMSKWHGALVDFLRHQRANSQFLPMSSRRWHDDALLHSAWEQLEDNCWTSAMHQMA